MQRERPYNPPPPSEPLPYQSPGAHVKSQWITDDGPGGRWLVGCLIVLGVVGAIAGAVGGVVWLVLTGF